MEQMKLVKCYTTANPLHPVNLGWNNIGDDGVEKLVQGTTLKV